MLAVLAISAQRAICSRIQRSSSCGVLPKGKMPRLRTLSANSCELTTARISADSLSSTGAGTPTGATMALNAITSKPGCFSDAGDLRSIGKPCGARARDQLELAARNVALGRVPDVE